MSIEDMDWDKEWYEVYLGVGIIKEDKKDEIIFEGDIQAEGICARCSRKAVTFGIHGGSAKWYHKDDGTLAGFEGVCEKINTFVDFDFMEELEGL